MEQCSSVVRENTTRDETDVTIQQLYNNLSGTDTAEEPSHGARLAPEQHSEVVLRKVLTDLFDEPHFGFEESAIKEDLDEILLLLIAHRSSNTHGKGLMGDLASVFDTRLSPGTVYPKLHELEEEDILQVQELVKTKEYRVEDTERMGNRVASAMKQHLALGLYYWSALDELPSVDVNVEFES
jgi:hypothetical protein